MDRTGIRRVVALAVGALLAFTLAACGSDEPSGGTAGGGDQKWVVGVSNTLVGNGWREEMICSVKAEALVSGKVSKVVVANRNGGPTEQIADLRSLISQGVNAIIVNPSDREKLNPVIKQAKDKGIVVVAVDQAVSAPEAYVATNDQVAYGRLGGEWLAKALGGKGNVVEMRGIAGVPADDDRHKGFTEALAAYPDIKVVKEVRADRWGRQQRVPQPAPDPQRQGPQGRRRHQPGDHRRCRHLDRDRRARRQAGAPRDPADPAGLGLRHRQGPAREELLPRP
jgi:ABC-type sugar transport system substrate-binding protein